MYITKKSSSLFTPPSLPSPRHMESQSALAQMGCLKFHFSQMGFHQRPQISLPSGKKIQALTVTCGLRDANKKPMWRSRVLSSEAIQAVHAMKLAKSSSKLEEVFQSRICRLLKADLLDTLTELRRQNELDLALKVRFFFCSSRFFYLLFFLSFFFFKLLQVITCVEIACL